jgi:hypothetical protein
MMNLVKVYSTSVNSAKQRLVKILRFGRSDVQTPLLVAPFGQDSNPIKGMVAVYGKTTADGSTILIGFINKNSLAGVGEYRTFSTDADGQEKFYTWLKSDGTMEIGGDTNFAVKYNELKAEYDKTKNYITTLKSATGAVAIALDALIPGTSAAFNAAMASQVVGDFSQTKNAKIKTIG